jgi:type IV pilus assembly protein PilY1
MHDMKRKLASRVASLGRSTVFGCLALASGASLAQELNDIPMAVKNNVAPNFMFMIDNSGSMSNIVPETPFLATTTYTASCPAATTGGNNIVIPAAGTTVTLNISGGTPYARIGSTDRRHTSVATSGNRVCFINTAIYTASLLYPTGSYLPAQYTGNYLNWYFGNYNLPTTGSWTSRKIVNTGVVRTRLEIAKASAVTAMDSLTVNATTAPANVRVGLSTYNTSTSGDGGQFLREVADFTATHKANIISSINALSPFGNTPLAETLADIGRYMATGYTGNITAGDVSGVTMDNFLRQNSRNSCLRGAVCTASDGIPASPTVGTPTRPVQLWCQRSYAFLMTDGRPQGDQELSNNTYLRDYDKDCQGALGANCVGGAGGAVANWDRKTARQYEGQGSDYLDDVAKALFDVDLRPNLVGPTDVGPGGVSVPRPKKNNLTTYTIGFADLQVLNDPLLVSAAKQGGGKALFPKDETELTGAFTSVITDAFASNAAAAAVAVANTQITENNVGYASNYRSGAWYGDLRGYSINTSSGLQEGPTLWSLMTSLRTQDPSTRKIATYNGSSGVAFAAGLTYAGKPTALDDGVINYLRGDRSGEISASNPTATYRTRQEVLGDIINAEPVVVNYGTVPIIFQGANDGMLHVVDARTDASVATRGQELWAYVPKLVHNNLAALTDPDYDHLYYVDGTPAVADVTGVGSVSRLLVGGLGKGGRGYYALDISTYLAATQADVVSKVMWEFSPTGMGYSYGTPLIVKVGSNWRVVVASGYDATVHGIWVLDPATGTGPFITAPSGSGLAHLGKLSNAAADADTRYVWGGDNAGNVFRFDLVSLSAVRIAALTDAGGTLAQPVTSAPVVSRVNGSATKFLVQLGTGRYLADADVPGGTANAEATQRQTLYGLADDTSVASPTLPSLRGTNGANCPTGGGDGDLVCQALTYQTASTEYGATYNAVDFATKRGWYLDLPTATVPTNGMINGRIINKPALTTGGTFVATINIPTNVVCEPGGRSWLVQLNSATGGAIPQVVGGNTYFSAGFYIGPVLSSQPVVVRGANGPVALLQGSDGVTRSKKLDETATTAAQWRRIYWRQVK